MSDLPDSLVRFDERLERAIERDTRRNRGRAPRRLALRLAATTAVAALTAFAAVSLLGDEGRVGGAPVLGVASAHERAAAVLSPDRGSVVHELAAYRHVAPDGRVAAWREETWRETSPPYARRQVTIRDGARVETATVGSGATRLYDAATDTIYTNPPSAAPSLGTPAPATEGDPLRAQLVELLRSDAGRDATTTTRDERRVIRFRFDNRWPDGSVVRWTYVVDARTYAPIVLTTATADGGRTTTRFERYETLSATGEDEALLSLRAQHPGAAVDRTEAGYAAAQARLYAPAG